MLDIKKIFNEHTKTYDIEIFNETQTINIFFTGSLDLCWCYEDNENSYCKSNSIPKTFIIAKENIFIYSLFEKSYNNVKTCNIYTDKKFKRLNKTLLNSYQYNRLFNNNEIKWLSDEAPDTRANFFNIVKFDEQFVVNFERRDKNFLNYVVIIRNSGSRYHPFNVIFMDMFNELQEINNYQNDAGKQKVKKR